ncbi:MAG: carbohydrate binding family 9 domain-containing protein, partial [Candidatus Aminicenantes bacterium]|nr:carbohydrate binding family 9 domain-containing protein [Candidatus Aminicenantes bacterium]
DPAWRSAHVITNLTQREPSEGEPSTESTEIRILYDDEYFYIGVVCYDSQPDKIVASEMRRDAPLQDNDYFEIYLDTYHDHRNAAYFMTNPLGARRDALIREEGSRINWDWDGLWYSKVQRDERGWTIEIAIPFYTLRFKTADVQTWGVNFGRHIARKREEAYWAPIHRDLGFFGKYRISYFGNLTGLEDLKQGKRLHLMPYIIGGGIQEEDDKSLSRSGDVGLDLKYRLDSNITADVSINTDFAQVEADLEQFNLTRFSLFFPEKRGFFLEGADLFYVGEVSNPFEPPGMRFFYSRTIGLSEDGEEIPVLGGVRVTGKTGSYSLGILDMLTDRISYTVDDEDVHIERMNHAVFRVKKDFLEKSTIGAMVLSRDSLDSSHYNRGAVFDFNLAFGQSFRVEGFMGKSFSPDLDGQDWAGYLDMNYNSDLLSGRMVYTDIGENFNSEMGYVPRVDMRKFRANFGIGPRPEILNLRQSFFFVDLTYIENHSGQLESRSQSLGTFNIFQNGSNLYLGYVQSYEYLEESFEIREDVFIPEGIHRFNFLSGLFHSDRSKKISIRATTYLGEFYNGNLYRISASGFVKLSKHLNIEFIYDYNNFDLPVEGGKFSSNIAATRIIYSFTPDLYAKAYLQYNDDEDVFRSNFLIRWIYKPGANIYFIYNETREVGNQRYLQDRVVMIKMTFLFN